MGYGHQGEAQALNLRDSGASVSVGARAGGAAEQRARAAGFPVAPLGAAAARADLVACLLPDEVFPSVFASDIRSGLRPDATLVFAHGFNLLYRPPLVESGWDVLLVAPAGPGSELRAAYSRGGIPAYVAVHQDGSGKAWEVGAAYGRALGCVPLLRTTVREETEVDLFGEQAVLCGGMNALVTAAFETLIEAGYAPPLAYLECAHQLTHLARLLQQKGMTGMRRSISATALYGDFTRGPRVLGPEGKARLRAILEEIRSGQFAEEWLEAAAGESGILAAGLERSAGHPMEIARGQALGAVSAADAK